MWHPRHDAADGNPQAARLLLVYVVGQPTDPVHPDAIARQAAAEAQADQAPPPLPAEREACLDADLHRTLARLTDPEARLHAAARALAEDIRVLRGLTTVPGGAGEPALEDRH
jgi:hypothetical protein